jgi:hypothetical protein
MSLASQPPDEKGKGPPPGGPARFELGRVLPPHLRDALELTDEQEQQLDDLEKEVKERLLKILTPQQKKKLRELRRQGPPPGGPGRPPEDDDQRGPGGPPPKDRPRPQDRPDRF